MLIKIYGEYNWYQWWPFMEPPTEYFKNRQLVTEAMYNVYEMQSQAKIVCYYRTVAGFATKATTLKAIRNKHSTA